MLCVMILTRRPSNMNDRHFCSKKRQQNRLYSTMDYVPWLTTWNLIKLKENNRKTKNTYTLYNFGICSTFWFVILFAYWWVCFLVDFPLFSVWMQSPGIINFNICSRFWFQWTTHNEIIMMRFLCSTEIFPNFQHFFLFVFFFFHSIPVATQPPFISDNSLVRMPFFTY